MSDVTRPAADDDAPTEPDEAVARSPLEQLSFFVSLPERAVRSGTGLVGGVLRESAALLVPQSFQTSRTYTVMVRQMLDFLVHDVGGVKNSAETPTETQVDNFVARKAVGNFVDLASMATLHISPVMLLAVVSDVAYGSQVYLQELARELETQGVVADATRIHHVNDLLSAVSDASAATSQVFNTPPLSVEALKQAIEDTRSALAAPGGREMLPEAEVQRMWQEMRDISDREGVGLLAVSTAATLRSLKSIATVGRGALSSVKVAGSLLDRHVLDHYQQSLSEIRQRGVYVSLAETSEPYLAAVWENFQPNKTTLTQDLISGKLLTGGWRAARKWLGKTDEAMCDTSTDSINPETLPLAAPAGAAPAATTVQNAPSAQNIPSTHNATETP